MRLALYILFGFPVFFPLKDLFGLNGFDVFLISFAN